MRGVKVHNSTQYLGEHTHVIENRRMSQPLSVERMDYEATELKSRMTHFTFCTI